MSDYSFSIRLYAQEYYHLSTQNNCEDTLFTLLFINFYFESNRFNIYKNGSRLLWSMPEAISKW